MFEKGEMIHTENSYKFNYEMIKELADNSGLEFSDYYTDENEYFSLCAFKLKWRSKKMQPIDAVWIIGLIGIFWFMFIRKDKEMKKPENKNN